ncbi:hypothetical protein BV25DRAFT_1916889 [Artomyces pyxidatus]|uniref:Uncharacterized protein n=1 Tax=Artomyces pyxidatus TaxID=48021 RepID=A0ACB8T0N1_9AGAM|nr:hypothetical protein BV25DRAFT_1916889 [Artomyces pyxidatus]
MAPSALFSIPNETILAILGTLNGKDILACSATCRHLHSLVAESVSLQYAIELFACGMFDGARGPHTLSVRDRLNRLQRYSLAWEQLLWTGLLELPHFVGCRKPLTASGDVLVVQRVGGGEPKDQVSLHVQRIPSELRAVDEHRSTNTPPNPMKNAYDVLLDSSQQLMINNRFRMNSTHRTNELYVSSLLTGDAHPLASPLIFMCQTGRVDDICGDLLLEMIPGSFPQAGKFVLLNWKTGIVQADYPGDESSFARRIFVDEHHVLCMSERDPLCLRVDSLVPAGTVQPASYEFLLPEFLQKGAAVRCMIPYACTLETTPAPHGCFYPDPADRLIVVEFHATALRRQFTIDVLARTLTGYIAAHPASPGQSAVVVPWDAWGTRGARMTVLADSAMHRTVSGSRQATLTRLDGPHRHTVLTVLDYCPRRVARAIARGTAIVLHGATVGVEHTGAGFGPLRTELACIVTEIPFPFEEEDGLDRRAWICENGVLFLVSDPFWKKIVDAWAHTI